MYSKPLILVHVNCEVKTEFASLTVYMYNHSSRNLSDAVFDKVILFCTGRLY